MHLLCLRLVLFACGLAWPLSAVADEDEAVVLPEIVVTGTRTAHAVDEAPVPTQVLNRATIEATTSTNVAQLLDEIPDLYVRQNDEFRLGASTVRMQGADANKVAILLNGRRFRGGVDGVVDLRDIPVDNVERIEILRGPASSLYGSDAMGGVVNIITKSGSTRPESSLTTAGGSFGRVLASATHGGRRGPVDYFLSYTHDEVEIAQQYGAISRQFADAAGDAKQQRDNLFADLQIDAAADHRLALSGNYNPVREGPQSHKDNGSANGAWTWLRGDTTTIDLSGSWYGFQRDNSLEGFEEDVNYSDSSGELRLAHESAAGLWRERHLLTLGHRFRGESLRSRPPTDAALALTDVDESATLNSSYVQDEIGLSEQWSLVAGSSFDVHEFYGAEANPRLQITYRPSDRLRLSFGVGRGFRAPDLQQLFDIDANNIVRNRDRLTGYVILGNRDLQPETDLGLTAHVETRPIAGFVATLGLFRHDFEDLIDVGLACSSATACVPGFGNPFPELNGQIFRYENIGAALTQGFDVALRFEPLTLSGLRVIDHELEVALQYGYLHTRNKSDRPGEQGNELPFRPPHRFVPTLQYGYVPWAAQFRLTAEYEDRTFTEVSNSPDFIAKAHWLLHGRIQWAPGSMLPAHAFPALLARAWEGTEFFVEGSNLLDEEFGVATPMGRVAGRRMLLGGVRIEL